MCRMFLGRMFRRAAGATAVLTALTSSGLGQPRDLDWRTFVVAEYGTRIQYRASTFIPAGQPETGIGKRFERADGRAILSVYSRPNVAGENPATYLRNNLRLNRSALDYT